MKTFADFPLSPALAKALEELGFKNPTPIQAETLPVLFRGATDFLGMAATGTGKTAAFGIPLLESIDPDNRATQGVVLCPTRELAIQVSKQLDALGKYKRVRVDAIYGGTGYQEQLRGLQRGSQVIVATPGRLIDHLQAGNVQLASVKTIVLDEADEMISMGFQEEVELILQHLPAENCQKWLFAATLDPRLRRVVDRYLKTPQKAEINRKEILSGTVRQIYYTVRDKNKAKGVCKLIDIADDFYGLIFCQTKVLVIGLTEYLRARGYRVDCLHGDKSQMERERTLQLFRERKTRILVCSDVAARGLDVKDLTHVINYSLPLDLESYIHRIGRTGRSGKAGLALSLVSPSQMHLVERIERITKSKMEDGVFPSRKEVSLKKLRKFLPTWKGVEGHEKASELLDEEWLGEIEMLTKREIAARFLALALPDLFEDREKAEEIGVEDHQSVSQERRAPRKRFVPRREGEEGDRRDRRWSKRPPARPNKGFKSSSRKHY